MSSQSAIHPTRATGARPATRRRVGPLRIVGAILALIALAIAIFLALFNWDWFRGPLGRFVSAKIHREVRIEGHLKVHLLTWTPTATVGRITVGEPAWAGPGKMAVVDGVKVSVSIPNWLKGRGVLLPLVEVDKPNLTLIQDAKSRANWDFSDGKKPTGKAAKLPPIQQFIINDGHIDATLAARKLRLAATVNAHEARNGGGGGFELKGQGSLNSRPFLMRATGGPLLNIQPDRPYAYDLDVRAGDTIATAKGQITRPFNFGSIKSRVSLSGNDLADLYYLSGITLPNTPKYKITADIDREETRNNIKHFTGTIGSSDIEGSAIVDLSGDRPKLTATARSRLLDMKDLAPVFGAGSRAANAGPKQKAAAQQQAATGRLLPDATLDIQRARAIDAKVDYRAAAVKGDFVFPIRGVHLGVNLDHGLLDLNPIVLSLPQGQLSGSARLDARTAVQKNAIDLRLAGVRLQDLIPAQKGAPPLEGVLEARAKLSGVGNSVHKAAASADGTVVAYVPQGRVKAVFAELAGVNVLKGLGLVLAKDQSDTGLRCALADFRVQNGVMQTRTALFDTDPTIVDGGGAINLNDESMKFRFQGHPKHFQLLRLRVGVGVNGPLRRPKVGVEPGGAILQAGAAVALAVVAPPAALILPFIDPGLHKGADCGAVAADAKSKGAPVKPAPPSALRGTPAKRG